MIHNVSINRSGKIPQGSSLPSYAHGTKIKQDGDAVALNYDVLLIAPTASSCKILTYDEYLSEDTPPTNVYALLCKRDPTGPTTCWIVYFVASVYGLSDAFPLQSDAGVRVRTICMSVQTRPGQLGDYMHAADFRLLWNINAEDDIPNSPIVFRPSYDKFILNPDGGTQMNSDISFAGGGLSYTLFNAKTGDIVSKSVLAVTHMIEGSSLNLDRARLLPDGVTVAPVTDSIDGSTVNYHVKIWDILGLHTDETSAQLYWSGLKYDPTSRSFSVVALRSGALAEAQSQIPSTEQIYVGVVYGMTEPQVGK